MRRRVVSLGATVNVGADYTDEQLAFLRAVDALKHRFPFPTWPQILALALALGYRRMAPPGPLPAYRRDQDA